eukprot:comp20530_c0_seq1/m.26314 comp20530_c0_seq1/g.26314  ORF comp20530_c0_seq1/g.26314 comp20530_c0_seq1/m.26314 type:complete len:479 (-) comp20530_c0_seq1:327-1763(-)
MDTWVEDDSPIEKVGDYYGGTESDFWLLAPSWGISPHVRASSMHEWLAECDQPDPFLDSLLDLPPPRQAPYTPIRSSVSASHIQDLTPSPFSSPSLGKGALGPGLLDSLDSALVFPQDTSPLNDHTDTGWLGVDSGRYSPFADPIMASPRRGTDTILPYSPQETKRVTRTATTVDYGSNNGGFMSYGGGGQVEEGYVNGGGGSNEDMEGVRRAVRDDRKRLRETMTSAASGAYFSSSVVGGTPRTRASVPNNMAGLAGAPTQADSTKDYAFAKPDPPVRRPPSVPSGLYTYGNPTIPSVASVPSSRGPTPTESTDNTPRMIRRPSSIRPPTSIPRPGSISRQMNAGGLSTQAPSASTNTSSPSLRRSLVEHYDNDLAPRATKVVQATAWAGVSAAGPSTNLPGVRKSVSASSVPCPPSFGAYAKAISAANAFARPNAVAGSAKTQPQVEAMVGTAGGVSGKEKIAEEGSDDDWLEDCY